MIFFSFPAIIDGSILCSSLPFSLSFCHVLDLYHFSLLHSTWFGFICLDESELYEKLFCIGINLVTIAERWNGMHCVSTTLLPDSLDAKTDLHVCVCMCFRVASSQFLYIGDSASAAFLGRSVFFIHDGFYVPFLSFWLLHRSRINSFTNMICFVTLQSNAMVILRRMDIKKIKRERANNNKKQNIVEFRSQHHAFFLPLMLFVVVVVRVCALSAGVISRHIIHSRMQKQ